MSELVQFQSDEDRLRAIDILLEAREIYSRIPENQFIVSPNGVQLLRAQGIGLTTTEERRLRREDKRGPQT